MSTVDRVELHSMNPNIRYGIYYVTERVDYTSSRKMHGIVDRKDNEFYEIDYDTMRGYCKYINILDDLPIHKNQSEIDKIVEKLYQLRFINYTGSQSIILASKEYQKLTLREFTNEQVIAYNDDREQYLDLTFENEKLLYKVFGLNALKLKGRGFIKTLEVVTSTEVNPDTTDIHIDCIDLKAGYTNIKGKNVVCNFNNVETGMINITVCTSLTVSVEKVRTGRLYFGGVFGNYYQIKNTSIIADCTIDLLELRNIKGSTLKICNTVAKDVSISKIEQSKFIFQNCNIGELYFAPYVLFDNVDIDTLYIEHNATSYEMLSSMKDKVKINKVKLNSRREHYNDAMKYIKEGKLDWLFNMGTEFEITNCNYGSKKLISLLDERSCSRQQ